MCALLEAGRDHGIRRPTARPARPEWVRAGARRQERVGTAGPAPTQHQRSQPGGAPARGCEDEGLLISPAAVRRPSIADGWLARGAGSSRRFTLTGAQPDT